MKVSVITPVFNGAETIESCIKSVLSQSYKDLEHLVIDGDSEDLTLEVVKKFADRVTKVVSGPDDGIYDALNKGIKIATGDIIGVLGSDDIYTHEKVIEDVVAAFKKENVDSCYGDLQYVDRHDLNKVIRYWRSSEYQHGKFRGGWMPPHPTFFVKKEIYEEFGCFNTNFKIAADYELMLRFLERYKISTHYIQEVLIKMRIGGVSNRSLKNMFLKSYEDYKAWKVNHLQGHFYTILCKNFSKLPQFLPSR